jgi:hypothetical protein
MIVSFRGRPGLKLFCTAIVLASLGLVSAVVPLDRSVVAWTWEVVPTLFLFAPAVLAVYLAGGVAIAVVWAVGHRPEGGALAVFLAFFILFWSSSAFALLILLLPDAGALAKLWEPAFLLMPVAASLTHSAFLRFSALYPGAILPGDLARWRAARQRSAAAGGVRRVAGGSGSAVGRLVPDSVRRHLGRRVVTTEQLDRLLLDRRVIWSLPLLWLVAIPLLIAGVVRIWPGGGGAAAVALWTAFAGVPAILLIQRGLQHLQAGFFVAAPADQARVRWLVFGFLAAGYMILAAGVVLALGMVGLPVIVVEVLSATLIGLAPLVLILFVAAGVFLSGAIDPSLVIRKTTLFGFVGVGLTLLFVLFEQFVTTQVVGRLGLPSGTGSIVSGFLVALLFGTVRARAERATNRVMERLTAGAGDSSGAEEPLREDSPGSEVASFSS